MPTAMAQLSAAVVQQQPGANRFADMAGVDLLTIRDGKIAEVHLFSEDGAAEDQFWG